MLRVRVYVAAITVAAVITAVGLYLVDSGAALDRRLVLAAASFAALGIFAHLLSFQLARGAVGSIAFVVYITITAVAPSWFAVVAIAAAVAVVEIQSRRPTLKVVFNIAQYSLAGGVSISAYLVLGGHSLLFDAPVPFTAYIGLFLTFVAVNTLSVSGVLALVEHKTVWEVWQENTLGTLVYDLLALPVVYVFARVYGEFGPLGALMLALPILGLRQLYKTNSDLQKVNQDLLQLMVAAIEARDPYTSGHSRRVSEYAKIIAKARGLPARQVERIGIAALLHDVGKIHEMYAPILQKPDRLTVEEQTVIQTHPIKSSELVANIGQLRDVVAPIRHHHENWDGTGYPDRLAGSDIPFGARVIMIADTIDAMTSDRPYRQALGEAEVRRELTRFAGKQFDPELCRLLLDSPLFSQLFSQRAPLATPNFTPGFALGRKRVMGGSR
ncbi:MAG: HD-GYP domain-containing protein [Gemmatimonadaceae bacterium]